MYRINAQSRLLEEAFIERGMPYLLVRGTRFYDRKEIKDVLAYLRLLHNPEDSVSLHRIINVPPRAIGGKTVEELAQWAFALKLTPWRALQRLVTEEARGAAHPAGPETPHPNPPPEREETGAAPEGKEAVLNTPPAPFKARARKSLVSFGQLMNSLLQAQEKLSLPELFDLVVARTGYKTFSNDGTPEGDERWENVTELRGVTTNFANLPGREGLAEFLEQVALVADVDALAEEGAATALLTLHTAKGLEFKAVFIVGLEEGLLPHSRSLSDPSEMEEERRLAYVGITRAKDQLYLTRAFRRRGYGGFEEPTIRSRFLDDIPADAADSRGRRASRVGAWSRGSDLGTRALPELPPTPPKSTQYQIGDKVRHPQFGLGTVINAEVANNEEYVQVAFPQQGIKKLAVSIARLEKRA
jgi:DNA helicase-2/ATP-dependent DNA helicase PcrA